MNIIFATTIFIFISASQTNAKTIFDDAKIEKIYLSLLETRQKSSRLIMEDLKMLNKKYKFPVYVITSKDVDEYEIGNGDNVLSKENGRKSIFIDKLERAEHNSQANLFVNHLNEELNDQIFKLSVNKNYNPGQYLHMSE